MYERAMTFRRMRDPLIAFGVSTALLSTAAAAQEQCTLLAARPFEGIAEPGIIVRDLSLTRFDTRFGLTGQGTETASSFGAKYLWIQPIGGPPSTQQIARLHGRQGFAPFILAGDSGRFRVFWAQGDSLTDEQRGLTRRLDRAVGARDAASARVLHDSVMALTRHEPKRVYEVVLAEGHWTEPQLVVEVDSKIYWATDQVGMALASDNVMIAMPVRGRGIWFGRMGSETGGWRFAPVPSTRIAGGGYANIAFVARHVIVAYIGPNPQAMMDRNSVLVMRSEDGGRSWSDPIVVQESGMVGAYGMSLLAMDGALHLVWGKASSVSSVGAASLWHAISVDAGITWSNPKRIYEEDAPQGTNIYHLALTTLDSGRVALMYQRRGSAGGGAYLNIWTGQQWQAIGSFLAGTGNVLDVAAIGADDGTLHVVAMIGRKPPSQSQLYYGTFRLVCD